MRNKPSRPPGPTAREALRAVPHRNEAAVLEPADGGVLVAVPLRRPTALRPPLSWILPYSSHRRVALDAIGARILAMCDGRRTVEEIVEAFADEFRLTFRESQLAVSQYLSQLAERGIVAVVGTDIDNPPAPQ